MFHFLEGKYQPLAPRHVFFSRVAQCFLITVGIVFFSLAFGTVARTATVTPPPARP